MGESNLRRSKTPSWLDYVCPYCREMTSEKEPYIAKLDGTWWHVQCYSQSLKDRNREHDRGSNRGRAPATSP